jgi:hypothetical protein
VFSCVTKNFRDSFQILAQQKLAIESVSQGIRESGDVMAETSKFRRKLYGLVEVFTNSGKHPSP